MYQKLLIYLLSLIIAINANESLQSYCGIVLVKELQSVCKSQYYGYGKRSYITDYSEINPYYVNDKLDYNELADLLFDNNLSTYSILNGNYFKRQLKVRSIVNECCRKPCSRATLSLYCSRPMR